MLSKHSEWVVAFATGTFYESAILKLKASDLPFDNIPMASANDDIDRSEIIKMSIKRANKYYKSSKFKRIVYVGDAVWDFQTSITLRIPFVGIGSKIQLLIDKGAKYVMLDYSDTEQFMRYLDVS